MGRHAARLRELRGRIRRRPSGEVVVDGRRLVADLVRWRVPLLELYLTPALAGSEEGRGWVAEAGRSFLLDPEVLAGVAPTRTPQGVLAVVAEPRWPAWPGRRGTALWLDAVQDPGNLGAIVRAAAGLGAAAVLLGPGCADPWSPAAVRGAAAAGFRLPVEREVTASRAVRRVREGGGEAWAATAPGELPAGSGCPDPLLLMLGAEGPGLGAEARALADRTVALPLDRGIESLNVAVAAGVLLWALRSGSGG